MAYIKPTVVAQNSVAGSFAAGCTPNKDAYVLKLDPGSFEGKRQCSCCERSA